MKTNEKLWKTNDKSKNKSYLELILLNNRKSFFVLFNIDEDKAFNWARNNQDLVVTQFIEDLIDRRKKEAWNYIHYKIIPLNEYGQLSDEYAKQFLFRYIDFLFEGETTINVPTNDNNQ